MDLFRYDFYKAAKEMVTTVIMITTMTMAMMMAIAMITMTREKTKNISI